jgi:aminoglycoside/choline kinase family phosphotransferase
MSTQPQILWRDPIWQKEAHEWIRAQAQRHSILINGEIEQPHIYPWSTVLRIPTNEGTLFFKATAAETVYESALTQKLVDWFPDCTPELLAVDTTRGWILMRDGGETLRGSIRPTQDVTPCEPVITRYAELQIGLAEHISEILALGIPDHRLAILPALYTQLLTDEESLMIDQEKGLTSTEWGQLKGMTARFEQLCTALADFGIPESINHGDFHDGNVLLKAGRITFFDWGDASVTHPFVTLRTFFVSMEIALKLDDYAPPTTEMTALLNRYLEQWQRFADQECLLSAYNLSRPVASIAKALA